MVLYKNEYSMKKFLLVFIFLILIILTPDSLEDSGVITDVAASTTIESDSSEISVIQDFEPECSDADILGYMFKNNGETAIITKGGSVLWNPNHDFQVFVELSCLVSHVSVGNEENGIDLVYDFDTNLWSNKISSDFLNEEENVLEIYVSEITKELPRIINIAEIETEKMYGGYEIYSFDGFGWERLQYSKDDIKDPRFNLLPGKYYIVLEKEQGWFYSPVFDIQRQSIVSLYAVEKSFPVFFRWLEPYFVSLEAMVFDYNYGVGRDIHTYEPYEWVELKDYVKERNSFLFMYINDWNPIYAEYLEFAELLNPYYEVILFTDYNNFDTLEMKVGNIPLYEIEGNLLDKLLENQSMIFFYDYEDNFVYGSYGSSSFKYLLVDF